MRSPHCPACCSLCSVAVLAGPFALKAAAARNLVQLEGAVAPHQPGGLLGAGAVGIAGNDQNEPTLDAVVEAFGLRSRHAHPPQQLDVVAVVTPGEGAEKTAQAGAADHAVEDCQQAAFLINAGAGNNQQQEPDWDGEGRARQCAHQNAANDAPGTAGRALFRADAGRLREIILSHRIGQGKAEVVTVKPAILKGTQHTLDLLRLTEKGNNAFHPNGFTTLGAGTARDRRHSSAKGTFGPPAVFYTAAMTGVAALTLPGAAFEARLHAVLRSRVEFIELIGEDLVAAGGKRTRPTVTFLAAQALGLGDHDPRWQTVTDLAVCIELLHSASLLHDDLIDDADTRRGQQAAFRRFGNVVSVMSGDFMLARLLTLLAAMPQGPALTRAFGEAASQICEGEVLQFQVAAYAEYGLAPYLEIIHGKTAALVELAAFSPALLLDVPEVQRTALATFGREYGLAFQMQDDLLDLMSDEATLGKPVGGDLREGKATLPVLHLLNSPHGAEVRAVLERRAANPGDVERVRELAQTQGAVEYTREEICRRARLAIEALEILPPSEAREALAALPRREIERTR